MDLEGFANLSGGISSIITSLSIVVAGIWAYKRFILQQEKYPNLIFTTDIVFIGKHENEWIIEVIANIENRGKAQHKMRNFDFDLNGISFNDELILSEKWGGQLNFPQLITKGSFLPSNREFFFIDPGTCAKYSYVTKVPSHVAYLILHAVFNYNDERNYMHSAERTVKVPSDKQQQLT